MDSNFTNENDPWEYSLDIDDSDLHLTPVLRSSSSAHVEPSPYTPNPVTIIPGPAGVVQLSNSICVEPSSSTPNPVRIIPGPAGLVQRAKLLKENVFILDPDGALMSTQEYMQKVVEDVGEDADFNSGAWVSATNYVNAFGGTVTGCLGDIDNFLKKGKLEQVVAIVKSCSPNALGDLNVTLKDLSGTVPGTIHYKVLDVGSYEKDITVGAAMILANVSVFTPKPSKHYLNITKRNVVEVFQDGTTRTKKYEELSATEKIQAGCDCKATNIVLQGLPPDVYVIVNHHKFSKEIWDRVKLLMQGTKLSLQEKEFQVDTKFLNSLPPEWSKFVTDAKLARDLHTTNYDQLYSYLEQNERHANETHLMRERYQDPLAFFPQLDSSLVVPVFNQGDDPITCLNKGNATSYGGNNAGGQARVVKCYNCQGEGHMARQCTQPKRTRNAAWFKEKAMLAEAQEAGQIMDEEQLTFLADPSIPDGQTTQTTIPNTAIFQTEDLDAYDYDCDDVSNAKAVLMTNLYNYGSDVISEVPHSDSYHNDMDDQSVHVMQDFEQTPIVDFSNNEIHSDSNIIPYSQ
ncbi:hypothetical protein Tco_1135562 [Tanacetum coccineum]